MKIEEQNSVFKISTGTKRIPRGSFSLRLTSMIDMFTILLVFLLKSFSTEGQIMTIAQDLRLPESTAQEQPKLTSVIAITREWILMDGRPVVQIEEILNSNNLEIESLYDELLRLRAYSEGLGSLSSQMYGFKGNIAIQGDKDITFEVLKKIMITCGNAGYNNMHLAVLEKEQ